MSDLDAAVLSHMPMPGVVRRRGGDYRGRDAAASAMRLPGEAASLPAAPEALPVDALKARIADMVRGYVTRRSPQLARCIADYSGALALHPALRDQPEQRTAFCRLNRHWYLLAAQCPAAAGA
jgi:hypothetical protein